MTRLGLTLQEGREILTGIEQEVVQSQVELQSGSASVCEDCQGRLRIKDKRKRRLVTVFGRVTVSCRRFIRCTCRGGVPRLIWPLASWRLLGMKRSSPERMYLLPEWGSKLPYRRAAELLNEILPGINRRISHTAIRRHTLTVGALLDQRILEPDEYASFAPPQQPVPAYPRVLKEGPSSGIRRQRVPTKSHQDNAKAGHRAEFTCSFREPGKQFRNSARGSIGTAVRPCGAVSRNRRYPRTTASLPQRTRAGRACPPNSRE